MDTQQRSEQLTIVSTQVSFALACTKGLAPSAAPHARG